MKKILLSTVGGMAAAFLLVGPVAAHVGPRPEEAPAGALTAFGIRVPNENPDFATIKVEVQFPPLALVRFTDVPGWDRKVTMKKTDEPLELFGEEVTRVVDTVVWSGGKIGPGNEYVDFPVNVALPAQATVLEFPAIQTYDNGDVVRWIGPADSDRPAGRLSVIDIGAGEGSGELALLADLRSRVESLETGGMTMPESEDDSDSEVVASTDYEADDDSTAMLLGAGGLGAGLLALILSLVAINKKA